MKKSLLSLIIICFLLLLGSVSVFAWDIPGVTVPFDPANYYSPTTISIPDSAPSIFALRDLARQGFQVQDVQNNAKSIIKNIKSLTEMMNQITSLTNQVKNMMKFSSDGLSAHNNGIDTVLQNVSDVRQSFQGLASDRADMNQVWSGGFRQVDGPPTERLTVLAEMNKEKELLQALEKTNKDGMAIAKFIATQQDEIQLLEESLSKLEGVNGEVENKQIQGQIDSIRVTLAIKKNQLFDNLVALKSVNDRTKIDQEIKDNINTKEGAAFGVNDPYHPDAHDQQVFTRPTGQGLIRF